MSRPLALRRPLFASFALVAAAAALPAQDAPTGGGPQPVDSLVVRSSAPVVLGNAGAVVVEPDSLPIAPAASLEQALREMPFVLVRQNSRGEVELSLRGSDSRQVAVLLDGVPLTLGWDHRSDPSLVPLTGAQRLVLVRGLSSLLGGPNVLGGVVEVDIARGAGAADTVATLAGGTGVGAHGARSVALTGGVPLAVGNELLSLRGGAGYRTRSGLGLSHGVRDALGGDLGHRSNSDLEQADGFASLRWRAPGGRYVGVMATGYRADRGVPPELHVSEPRLWRYPSVSRTLAIVSAGSGATRTPVGHGSLDLAAGANFGSMDIESFDTPAYETPVGRERGEERTLTARLQGQHTLPGEGDLRAAVTGAEVRYDERLGHDPASRYRQRLWSAGIETRWPLLGGGLVGVGVVRDWTSTPETGGKPAHGTLAAWGWRLGATSPLVADGVRFHASVSRRARFAALRELYSGALNRFEPNPRLRPERLLGVEAGATLVRDLGDGRGFDLQMVAFHHRLADAIVRETTTEGLFRRVNRHAVRSTGAEVLAGWAAAGFTVTGDILLQRVRQHDPTGAEGRAEHRPEVRGHLGAGAPLGHGIRLMGTIRYDGAQSCVHPDLGQEVSVPGGAQGDVGLEKAWALGEGGTSAALVRSIRMLVAVDNVSDAARYDQCGLPRPGRALRLAIQFG